MKRILASVFIFAILAICAGDFEILNRDGKRLSAEEKRLFKLETAPGKNYRYRLTSLSDKPQYFRIRFSTGFKGDRLTVFDGFSTFSLKKDQYRKHLLALGGLPLCAVWNNDTGTALAAGAEDLHTIMWGEIRRTGSNVRLILEVNGALLHKGAAYSGVWHEIKFSPKYGERDALAGYYALYPQCFKRNPAVDPRVGGSSCQYASWNSADPEVCRWTDAGWEWCISSQRNWGNLTYEYELPEDRYSDRVKFTAKNGKHYNFPRQSLTKKRYLEILEYRLSNGYLCGIANAFYSTALSRIHPNLGQKFPDSVSSRHMNRTNRVYDKEAFIWAFPETSWGQELRRQSEIIAKTYDVKAFGFDVNVAAELYRGSAIGGLSCNVGWDEHGPCVSRGVANALHYKFLHTLNTKYDGFKTGAISNGLHEPYHAFHADAIMIEQHPFFAAPPWPQPWRYAMGEKCVSFWETYPLKEIDPNIRKTWTEEERSRLIRELSRFAVHRSMDLGITLPAWYLTEYVYRLTPAMHECFSAGWKPVPGMQTKTPEITLTRYGSGEEALGAVCNLNQDPVRPEIEIFPGEFRTGRVGGGNAVPLLFAGFHAGRVTNSFRGNRSFVKCAVPGLGVNFLESAGSVPEGSGTLELSWDFALEGSSLTVRSIDFSGRVRMRETYPRHQLDGNADKTLKPGEKAVFFYRNTAVALTEKLIRDMKLTDKKHQPCFTLFYAPDPWSKVIAERIAYFFRKQGAAASKNPKFKLKLKQTESSALNQFTAAISLDGNIPELKSNGIGGDRSGIIVRGSSRYDLDLQCRVMLNILNRIKYPDYVPGHPMDAAERKILSEFRF